MDVITQPTLINIVYPIEVFDFHQLILLSDTQGVGIALSIFLVASVEYLLQVACVLGGYPGQGHRGNLSWSAVSRPNAQYTIQQFAYMSIFYGITFIIVPYV